MAKQFSQTFWVANTVELLERLAYYAVFVALTMYLSNVWGFTDVEAGIISGVFSALLYLLPTFAGAYADKIGFRSSILLAFTLLTIGYFGLSIVPTMLESAGLVKYGFGDGSNSIFSSFLIEKGWVEYNTQTVFKGLENSMLQWTIVPILILIVIGGAYIKAVISGTIARETTSENRARGYSLFYMMINLGTFIGIAIVDPLRKTLGDNGLIYLNYFSASMTFFALIAVYFFYKSVKTHGQGKSFSELWKALIKLCTNVRLFVLILIVSGFWIVYQQLYATMPKYVLRMIGEGASPAWYVNVNPLIVFFFVNIITSFMKKKQAIHSMIIGMSIIPVSALIMATGNLIHSESIMGMHPIAFMMIAGIALQAIAECFISPRYLEYFSLQSPKGEEGLYLGFSQLHTFFSSLIAFISSGVLLDKFCPNPKLFTSREAYAEATVNAHYIWYVFVGVGLISAIALFIYNKLTKSELLNR